MIALVATLGLTLLALALLGGIAFVARGPSSVRRANTLPDRPFVPTEIDAPLHAPLRHYAEGAATIDLDGDVLDTARRRAKQGKPLHCVKRVKRSKRARGITGSVALALLFAAATLAPLSTTAQGARFHHGADADLWNTRAAIGELGWRAPDDAYAAIVEVHVRRAQLTGTTTAFMARRYSAAVRRPPPHRAWVPELHTRNAAPPSWPPHLDGSWWRYAERVGEVREIVRAVLRGERGAVCEDAEHYGSEADGVPGGQLGRWEAACSFEGTSQRWWKRVRGGMAIENGK